MNAFDGIKDIQRRKGELYQKGKIICKMWVEWGLTWAVKGEEEYGYLIKWELYDSDEKVKQTCGCSSLQDNFAEYLL